MGTKSARPCLSARPSAVPADRQKRCRHRLARDRRISGAARTHHLPSEPTQRIEALKWAALTDGLMDAAAKHRVEQLRPKTLQWPDWLARQRQTTRRTERH